MTNYESFEKNVKEMENENIPLDAQNTIYLGFIASSLAQIADALNKNEEAEKNDESTGTV